MRAHAAHTTIRQQWLFFARRRDLSLVGCLETGANILERLDLLALKHCRPQLLADGFVVGPGGPYNQAVFFVRFAPVPNVRLL